MRRGNFTDKLRNERYLKRKKVREDLRKDLCQSLNITEAELDKLILLIKMS